MARLLNVSCKEFRKNAENKKVYLWGAGRMASQYIQSFCKGLDIASVVDRNDTLNGTTLIVDAVEYHIVSEEKFLKELKTIEKPQHKVVIFITSSFYAADIMKHLNELPLLDLIICYAGVLIRDFYEKYPFEFTKGKEKIPKKIHYCWFGEKNIPDHLKRYIDTWYRYCPDYEIIRWDETNYDISKNQYMKEAYECKKWGFVPDYARLDIVYNEGGIYLDTDVELLNSLDVLLCDDMFCGFANNNQIAMGLGFGAVRGHSLIKKLRDYYDKLSFCLDDGQLNLKTCNEYQQPVLEEFGFELKNVYQQKDGVVLYPSEVLSPDNGLILKNYTEKTIAMHHADVSWASEREKEAFKLLKTEIKDLIER